MICLPKQIADNFLRVIDSGELNVDDLAKMSSAQRVEHLKKFVGKFPAAQVNTMFEKKLLLKNQNSAMISWAKEVAGLKPTIKRDLLSRIEKLDKVLTPDEEDKFLADLVADKLGTRTTFEQAKDIATLSKKFQDAKKLPMGDIRYGVAEVNLNNYLNDLRLNNEKVSFNEVISNFKENAPASIGRGFSDLAGAVKGIKASLDNSAIFRQGWKTLFTNPQIWANNAAKTIPDIWKQLSADVKPGLFSGQYDTAIDAVKAEIYSRANARNGLYKKMKLDIGDLEEAFPSTIPEKIPLFGRLYKASEAAYTGFLYRMRADIADKMAEIATSQGLDLNVPLQSESIGRLVNSLTGRGNLGAIEKYAKPVNTIFFSPKMLKSQIDMLTTPLGFDVAGNPVSTFARNQAAQNLLKTVSGIATILGTAYALDPKTVELDPRSADFGKIRIGDTRFDMSGGLGSVITLAVRQMMSSTKSSTTGQITKLNQKNRDGSPKFGTQTRGDLFFNFMENKYAPMFSMLKQLRDQETFEGGKPTALGLLRDSTLPLTIDNIWGASENDKAANLLLIGIAETLGISTNTYSNKR